MVQWDQGGRHGRRFLPLLLIAVASMMAAAVVLNDIPWVVSAPPRASVPLSTAGLALLSRCALQSCRSPDAVQRPVLLASSAWPASCFAC
jgi:hypothetical protein